MLLCEGDNGVADVVEERLNLVELESSRRFVELIEELRGVSDRRWLLVHEFGTFLEGVS